MEFAVCTRVKLGWGETCYNLDTGTADGLLFVRGLRSEHEDVALVLGRYDGGIKNTYGTLVVVPDAAFRDGTSGGVLLDVVPSTTETVLEEIGSRDLVKLGLD
jgi:hypothetical protein